MAPKQKIRIEIVGADEIAWLNREALLAAIRLSGMELARGPDGRLIVVDITHGPKEYYSIHNYDIVGPPCPWVKRRGSTRIISKEEAPE